jgi:hypothetical protein
VDKAALEFQNSFILSSFFAQFYSSSTFSECIDQRAFMVIATAVKKQRSLAVLVVLPDQQVLGAYSLSADHKKLIPTRPTEDVEDVRFASKAGTASTMQARLDALARLTYAQADVV